MTKKEKLKLEHLEEFKKQYNRLAKYRIDEYTFIGADDLTNEADDEEMPEPTPDMGNNPEVDNQAPQGTNANQGAADDMSMPQNGESDGVEGFNPQEMGDEEIEDVDGDIENDETEEVIDVDDLTKTQEETEDKVEMLSAKFDKVFNAISSFEELIANNDAKLDDLKAEFERRNPTQLEKLSMQTAHSYPFSVTPQEYWAEKEKTSNYRTEDDEDGVNQGQYVITKSDIDNDTDWLGIAKSLDDISMNPSVKDFVRY